MTTDKIQVHHTLEIISTQNPIQYYLGHVCSYYSFVNIGIHLFGRGKHRKSNFCWQPNFKIYTKMAQFQNHSPLAAAGIFSDITKWAHKFHWSISANLKYVALLVIQFNMVKAHIWWANFIAEEVFIWNHRLTDNQKSRRHSWEIWHAGG